MFGTKQVRVSQQRTNRGMNTERFRISDEIWSKIQWVVPGKESDPGRTGANNRLFVEAVVFIARTGAPWRDLPRGFGPWNSIYKRFARWADKGVWAQIFDILSQNGDYHTVMLDSTVVRAHQHAAGAQKKEEIKQLGALAVVPRQRSMSRLTRKAG